MLEKFYRLNPLPKDIPELKSALMKTWNDLPQNPVCKSITNYRKQKIIRKRGY